MQLAIFKYQEENDTSDFTTIEIDGQPWFIAIEVCLLLDIRNTTQALSALDDDEKLPYVIHRTGQNRAVNLVSESGLYSLVFSSKKESAKKFRKWVTSEVIPSLRKTGSYGINRIETPNFVVRYNDNWERVERGRFSVISELFIRLYGKFEHAGYQIPNKAFDGKEMRPDSSVGKMFATHLREVYPDQAENYTKYKHKFPNGMEFDARQYPNNLLPHFIKFVDEHWLPNNAPQYFKDRDPLALDFLPKLLK